MSLTTLPQDSQEIDHKKQKPKGSNMHASSDNEEDRKLPAKDTTNLYAQSRHSSDETTSSDEEIAKALQELEYSDDSGDDRGATAKCLQEEKFTRPTLVAGLFQKKAARASPAIQSGDTASLSSRKRVEEHGMQEGLDGRAWLFVKRILDLHSRLSTSTSGLAAVAVDDMVFLCTAFMECAQDFKSRGISSRVTLAYHYTNSECIGGIREDGLMTLAERKRKDSDSTGRAAFGDGVYVASNPTAFSNFGDTGLLVAIIQGNTKRVTCSKKAATRGNNLIGGAKLLFGRSRAVNTVIGNKMITRQVAGTVSVQEKFTDELVLQESRQCLPLMQFNSRLIRTSVGRNAVWKYHQEIQQIFDQEFNGGKQTKLKRVLLPAILTVETYNAPEAQATYLPHGVFKDVRPSRGPATSFCAICRDSLWNSNYVCQLKVCGHQYHRACIEESLKMSPKCPTCRAMVRKPQGQSPSGKMTLTTSSVPCKGFERSKKSIIITYTMPSGIQKSYHPNPGHPYQGTTRIAYLPSNQEGWTLVKRLKYAFNQGLTFTIGTSLTTGQPDCVVWASIHHKTCRSGGVHGFPDPSFFANCNSELDALGVPNFE